MKTSANRTELVFILDRSGSMIGLEQDTIGGFNSMLRKQKDQPGAARVTTVLFDDQYQLLHDRLELEGVKPITGQEYYARGSTALLDAIGRTIRKVDGVLESSGAEYRADKVLFVIITDGMENSSRRHTQKQIADMVKERQQKGWEFLFLGANMDAISVAQGYGIGADRSVTYVADAEGVALNFNAVSGAASALRNGQTLSEEWSSPIRKRGK